MYVCVCVCVVHGKEACYGKCASVGVFSNGTWLEYKGPNSDFLLLLLLLLLLLPLLRGEGEEEKLPVCRCSTIRFRPARFYSVQQPAYLRTYLRLEPLLMLDGFFSLSCGLVPVA